MQIGAVIEEQASSCSCCICVQGWQFKNDHTSEEGNLSTEGQKSRFITYKEFGK